MVAEQIIRNTITLCYVSITQKTGHSLYSVELVWETKPSRIVSLIISTQLPDTCILVSSDTHCTTPHSESQLQDRV